MKLSPSLKIYLWLVIVLSLLSALNVFLPQGSFLPPYQLPAPKAIIAVVTALIMFVLYGGLGLVGLTLSRKLGFAEIRDEQVSNRQRFLTPALVGAALGLFFIGADTILSHFHSLGNLPHPPFPTSLVASIVAGIGEEIIFRLFFVSFWTWLISSILLKRKWQSQVFWMVTVLSAFAFAAAHLPSVMMLFSLKQFNQIPPALLIEILLLNGMLSVAAAYYFRKYGFLAAVGIHFWADVVWHVIWGLF
ncbi:CPBP family glutamic-type intramembrane protease [Calditrichota bacterium LG25]